MKNKTLRKYLCIVLSLVMAFSVTAVALPQFAPTVFAANISDAQWNTLIAALKLDNVKDAQFNADGTNAVKADDPSGNLLVAAEAYYDAFNTYKAIQTGNGSENNAGANTRTASKVNAYIKNQLQTKMGDDFTAYNVANVLLGFNANYSLDTLSSNDYGTSARDGVTLKVTITNSVGVLGYDSIATLPDSVMTQVVYTYVHGDTYYSTGSGCNAVEHHYARLTSVTRTPTSANTSAIKTLYNVCVNNAAYFGYSFDELLALGEDGLAAAKTLFKTPYDALLNASGYSGAAAYEKYISAYDVAGLIDQIDAAIAIASYVEIAQWLQSKTEVVVAELSFQELSDLYFLMRTRYNNYKSAPAAAKSYLEENGYIDIDAADAKFIEIENEYELRYLRDVLAPRIEEDLALYATYDDDWVIATGPDAVSAAVSAAMIELESIRSDLSSKKPENVVAVFGEDYFETVIQPVIDGFEDVLDTNDLNRQFLNYQATYNSVFAPLTLNETSTQLLNILRQRDGWYSDLLAFAEELRNTNPELAAKIFTDAEAAMEAKINATYAALNAILEGEINDAYAIYLDLVEATGLVIDEVTMDNYNELRSSIGLIEVDAYEFLEGSPNFTLAPETVEKYEALRDILIALRNYDPSHTLSAYKYNAQTLEQIIRYVSAKDIVRDRDYAVEDADFANLIGVLQNLLTGDGLAALGVELDIAGTLDGIWNTFYTDKFVNTLMNALYPMLAELVRDQLNELVGSYLSLMGNLDDAFAKLNVGLSPKKVGNYVDSSKYPAIANALKGVTGSDSGFMYGDAEAGTNCWNSTEARNELYRAVVDENNEPVLDEDGNPTYELIFDWGIDAKETLAEKKEAFLEAVDSALKALQPLFMALLCNKAVAKTQIVSALGGLATVSMGMFANDGYNNTLLPIFEALGVHADALYDAKTYTRIRDIFEFGLFSPLADLLDQIKGTPLEKILDLLPNLAFAIQNQLFLELLHNLKVDLDISGGGCAGGIINNQLPAEGVSIDLYEELDFVDLLGVETFYDDIKTMDGVLKILMGLLMPAEEAEEGEEPAPELVLPHMDGAKLAMLGTDVEWNDSFRSKSQITYEGRVDVHANIIANRPQVMQFLVEFLLEAIKDENFLPAIQNMLAKEEEPAEGDEPAEPAPEEPAEATPDILTTILDNIITNGTDAIAAIFELIRPADPKYTMPDAIDWITEGNINSEDQYQVVWADFAGDVGDLNVKDYQTKWTKADISFVDSKFEQVLGYILKLDFVSEKIGGATTVGGAIEYLLANFITADTANSLVETIGGLFGGLELPEAIADLGLLEQLGLDVNAWDNMTFNFEPGDLDAFKAALVTILNPLNDILAYVLTGAKNLELSVLGLDLTAVSYDAYSYGLVPLLEALNSKAVPTTAYLQANPDKVVSGIVDALFSVVDQLLDDPIGFLRTVLPKLIYFIKVDGPKVAANHLLVSVNVLLDTIRPIYDIDLFALIKELTAKEDEEGNVEPGVDLNAILADPVSFLLQTVVGLVSEKLGITLQIDFELEDFVHTIHFTDPTRFDSANGDDGYTIALSEDGRLELLARTFDFVLGQVLFRDNFELITDAVAGLAGEGEEVPAIVTDILNNVKNNYPDSIVAAFRLLFPDRKDMRQEYNTYPRLEGYSPLKAAPVIEWTTEGNIGAADDWMGTDALPEGHKTLWTEEKAVYMAEHLGDFLNDIVIIFGEQLGGASTVEEAIDFLVKNYLTAENANAIAAALKNLIASLGLPDTIFDVAKQIGVDLTAWDDMSFSFADGDKTAFKNALIEIIDPIAPILRMILVDKGDLEGTVLDALPITIHGYDGYSYGIVPLLEALGATGVKTTSAFKADKAHVAKNLVDPVFSILDHLIADPIAFIEDVLPGILFYDYNKGVQVAIPNLLYAINVVLDTLFPIYDLDIYELVEEKTGVDLHFAEESPVDFLLTKIADVIEENTDVRINIDFTVATLTETLHFTEPEAYTSANGDTAYRIRLTTQGKAELLSRVLDYGINQVIFEDNFDKLSEIFSGLITDDDTRAFVIGLLSIMKHADQDYRDLHGIHDVALAELFWIFFGADSVTDAVADFFYRYKDLNFFEMLYLISDKAPDYIQRIEFIYAEVLAVEYPAALELIENAEDYLKPPYEYNEHETAVVSGVLGRILAFFTRIISFFKNLFGR
ncbi:MAG: hypothetical protein IK104_09380 [Clostridia bacterium]|nr:hypothetical protein [Clostridia bacterium]